MHGITQLADRALVEAFLLTRDETVFRLLYRRHKDALWRLALRLNGGDRPASEDVVQDAWLRAIERLPQFRWESSLRTWFLGFVVMLTRERWRSQRPYASLETALFEQVAPDFRPEKVDLEAAFSALSPGYRAVLTLHDIEGFKHEEIATMLGISIGTSKSQLSRARSTLRQMMQNETIAMP